MRTTKPAAWEHACGQLGVLLVMCVLSALMVRHGCLVPPPPVSRPDPGTPRADFCRAVGNGSPWLLFVVAPLATLSLWQAVPAARRRPAFGWTLVAAWTVALFVGAALAVSLESAYTI
jgi:hypothetical protein